LTIAYGRFLGNIKFGELYFAITFVSLIGFPVEVGFNQQLVRDVAMEPKKAQTYLWNTLLIKVILWMLAYTIMLVIVQALGYNHEQTTVVAICGITLLIASIVNTFAALHCAFERIVFPAMGMMLEKGISAAVGYILLKNGAGVQMMALVLLGGSVIDALWVGWWFFRQVGVHFALEKETLFKLLRTSIPFILYGALGVIYYRIDTVLLSMMTTTAVVGWYGAAYRLFDTFLFIPNLILNAVMYPVFARLSVTSQSGLKTAVEKCMNLLLICSIPIATLMIVAAPAIIGFVYHSPDFANSVPAMQALAPGLVFIYINTLLSSVIIATKGEKKIPMMAAAALVLNLSLNFILIPLHQHIGTAIVTSLTELLLLCISFFIMPNYLLPAKSILTGVKTLIASLCMAAVLFLLRTESIFILLPVGFLTYAVVVTLFRTIPRADIQSLYQAIKRKSAGTIPEAIATTPEEEALEIEDVLEMVDTLTHHAVAESYLQISQPRLPVVVPAAGPLFEVRTGASTDAEDDDATEIRRSVMSQRNRSDSPISYIPGNTAIEEQIGLLTTQLHQLLTKLSQTQEGLRLTQEELGTIQETLRVIHVRIEELEKRKTPSPAFVKATKKKLEKGEKKTA